MGRVVERDLPVSVVRDLLEYDPETGELFWDERDISMFKTEKAWRIFTTRFVGKEAGSVTDKGYKALQIMGQSIACHRVAWAHYHGEWPDQIDHINGNRMDNRISNLRNVNHRENSRNRCVRFDNSTGQTGVYEVSGRWVAMINTENGRFFIGRFVSYEDAVFARKIAEKCFGYHENHGRKQA